MANKFYKKLRQLRKLWRSLDHEGLAGCLYDELLGIEKLRKISIEGVEVWVRTSTPDLYVAISSLHEKEYGQIKCPNPKVIVDAGGNIGTSAMFFAIKYPDATIYSIEPEESNFELLVKNTSRFENVVPLKAAIWGATETRTVHNRSTGHWGYTVVESAKNAESTGQQISCITIPELMKQNGFDHIDLLKMDIEGGEKDVLKNANDWIDQVTVLTVELHDKICMGCDRAFYLATQDFHSFEKQGDKVIAYRA